MDEWTKGHGIGDPIEVTAWRPNWDVDIDDDQHFDKMKYFPHKGKCLTIITTKRVFANLTTNGGVSMDCRVVKF